MRHLDHIEQRTDDLAKGLIAARAAFEAAFWTASGLSEQAKKAQPADDQPLNSVEADALLTAIASLGDELFLDAFWSDLSIALTFGWDSARELLKADIGFDVVPSWAMSALREHVDEFSSMVVKREKDFLVSLVDDALSKGATPKALGQTIAEAFADGYHVASEDGTVTRKIPTKAWSLMVARTELSRAQTQGAMDLYTAAGVQEVLWATTEGKNVCPRCAGADGKIVKLGENFPSVNVPAAPAHPMCACAILPAQQEQDIAA